MNRSPDSATSQIQKWAARQMADYDAHCPGTMFAEGVVLDVAAAYELQSAVAQLRAGRGERIIGYKVGCTSPSIRAQLGIDHCVTGRLYESEQHVTGSVLSRAGFVNLAIEGELAVELSREPEAADFAAGGIPACVARVFPVIELHNYVTHGERPSAGELIANNAIHAGFVASDGLSAGDLGGRDLGGSDLGGRDLGGRRSLVASKLSILANDHVLAECSGTALVQTINSSLLWLSQTLRERGDVLGTGQIVLTGSIPSLIPLPTAPADYRIRVDAGPLGSVAATFVP